MITPNKIIDISKLTKHQMKDKAKAITPIVWLGKSGLTEGVISELKKQIKQKRLVKVKMLKAFIDGKNRKDAAIEVAAAVDADLVDNVGFVVVLSKKKKAKIL